MCKYLSVNENCLYSIAFCEINFVFATNFDGVFDHENSGKTLVWKRFVRLKTW